MLGQEMESSARLAGARGHADCPPSCPGPRLHTCPCSKGKMTAFPKGTSQKLQGPGKRSWGVGRWGSLLRPVIGNFVQKAGE